MLQLEQYNQFGKDYKLARKRGKKLSKMQDVVDMLLTGKALPARCRPHKLKGKWEGYLECHIEPDWLLIYDITPTTLYLVRTGTHTDLFD